MRKNIRISESQMKRIIAESTKKVLNESSMCQKRTLKEANNNDYSELGIVISIEAYKCEEIDLDRLYLELRYEDIASYLSQWDYGTYDECVDDIDTYEKIIFEDDEYILTVANDYMERIFTLYAKLND